jgi:hypothetical protein
VDGLAAIVVVEHLGSDIVFKVRKVALHKGGNYDARLALWWFR